MTTTPWESKDSLYRETWRKHATTATKWPKCLTTKIRKEPCSVAATSMTGKDCCRRVNTDWRRCRNKSRSMLISWRYWSRGMREQRLASLSRRKRLQTSWRKGFRKYWRVKGGSIKKLCRLLKRNLRINEFFSISIKLSVKVTKRSKQVLKKRYVSQDRFVKDCKKKRKKSLTNCNLQ